MKKTYCIIPTNNIWNHTAIVARLRQQYPSKDEAIAQASVLSREYNADFFVCALEVKVSTVTKCVDLV